MNQSVDVATVFLFALSSMTLVTCYFVNAIR